MKRLLVVLLTSGLALTAAFAYPGIGGGRGLFRTQNALVEDEAGLTISLHAIGRNPTIGTTDDKAWVVDALAPELSYAPLATEYVGAEVFGSWGGLFQYPEDPGGADKEFGWGLHDLTAGAKLSVPVVPVLKVGGSVCYDFIGRDDETTWLDPRAVPAVNGLGWSVLTTLYFQDLAPSLPNVLLNYTKRDEVTIYAAGVELAAEDFGLFAEARSLQPDNSTGILDTDHGELRVTPGVAFGTTTSGATLKAGYTFSFGNEAPNEAVVGLVIATPFGKRTPPEYGTIVGRIVDARTGEPLGASVNFPENPRLSSLTASATTGVFTVERVPAGVVVVEVDAEGYQRQAVPINVEGDVASQYEFALRPLITYGVIAGLVTDAKTNKPLEATIEFPETDIASMTSDPATGGFRLDDVPVAVYTVTAEAEGYFKASLTVQVEEGRVASPTFALKPLTMKSTITGKVSDKKTGEPLAAVVEFPDSDVPSVTTDGETGVYRAEIPVGSYAMKVTAEDYIAQTAAVVLEEDKPTLRDFELVKKGMTITLRGVYFDFNKATIKPESHPALADAAKILTDNPSISVEIQGHTDAIGSDEYNQKLSERRAQAVVAYLVQNLGIDVSRLTARGYGESKPIASNDTDEGRALNRRVEFVIVK